MASRIFCSRLPSSFRNQIFPLWIVLEKRYVGKMVDRMTQGSCIPIDSVKSRYDDCFSLIHNIGSGAYDDSDNTNSTYLVG